MKHILIIIYLTIWSNLTFAQTDTIHIHYHKNGKVSTISILEDNRSGKARAYNQKGELIYEKEIRRFAGNASVRFTHHENGGVKSADYTSHPDAGIQWYKSETIFSENGEVIKTYYQDHYNTDPNYPPKIIKLDLPPVEKPKDQVNPKKPQSFEKEKKQKQEIVECAPIHENTVQIVNHSKYKIEFTLIHQNKDSVYVIQPGAQVEGPKYISADTSNKIQENMNFRYSATRKNKNIIHLTTLKKVNPNKTTHIINLFESRVEKD